MAWKRILLTKELSGGHVLYLVKYGTDHPKNMSEETKRGWYPGFNGSHEVILGLDKRDGGYYQYNTHPRLSWYVPIESLRKIPNLISIKEDFFTVEKLLNNFIVMGMNHIDTTRSVEGLVKLLQPSVK